MDHAGVLGNAVVFGNTRVFNNTIVGGSAIVGGYTQLYTGTTNSDDDYFVIGPIGNRSNYTTIHLPSQTVCCDCFHNTLDAFEAQVKITHANNKRYRNDYLAVIHMARLMIEDIRN
jgi:hypothetical protein